MARLDFQVYQRYLTLLGSAADPASQAPTFMVRIRARIEQGNGRN
jgi:hypothetical protein